MDNKQKVFVFLQTQKLCVIATVDKDNKPEAALIGFAEKEDLSLVFGTDNTSRKYKNFLIHPNVAFTFYQINEKDRITVQYEGEIVKPNEKEMDEMRELLRAKSPGAKKYEENNTQIYVKVIPKWIRYLNYGIMPNDAFEISF